MRARVKKFAPEKLRSPSEFQQVDRLTAEPTVGQNHVFVSSCHRNDASVKLHVLGVITDVTLARASVLMNDVDGHGEVNHPAASPPDPLLDILRLTLAAFVQDKSAELVQRQSGHGGRQNRVLPRNSLLEEALAIRAATILSRKRLPV